MDKLVDQNTLSDKEKSLETILSKIAIISQTSQDLLSEITAANDSLNASIYSHAVEQLQMQIGWLADLGTKHLVGFEANKGNAENWFLPHNYAGSPNE